MLFIKATEGVVLQLFNDAGECIAQKFIAGDLVEYETFDGHDINHDDMPLPMEYQPFEMVQPLGNQPEEIKEWLK